MALLDKISQTEEDTLRVWSGRITNRFTLTEFHKESQGISEAKLKLALNELQSKGFVKQSFTSNPLLGFPFWVLTDSGVSALEALEAR